MVYYKQRIDPRIKYNEVLATATGNFFLFPLQVTVTNRKIRQKEQLSRIMGKLLVLCDLDNCGLFQNSEWIS